MSDFLAVLDAPDQWHIQRFDHLVDRVQEIGRSDLQPLSVFLDQGVVPRSARDDNYNRLGADLSKYLIVKPGDIVFNKLRTWQGGLGVSKYEGIVSPAYYVCRPKSGVEPRFLHYLLRSATYLQELTRISKWMPPSQFDIGWQDLRLLPTLAPNQDTQRAIADFLDAETARIDALIEKKRRMIELLNERRAGHIEHAIRSLEAEWGEASLKYLVREVTVGIVVTPAAWYSETGVPALRGQNVKPGRIVLDDLVYLTKEGHALHKKSELRAGDVVVVRTGQAGAAAVVPTRVAGANCIDLIVVRPSSAMDTGFLEYVLNSDWTQKHVEQHSVGSIQSHFNVSAMKEVPVPLAPVHRQREVVKRLGRLTDRIDGTVTCLNRQIELLTEHRQALITAAVTGQVEVPEIIVAR